MNSKLNQLLTTLLDAKMSLDERMEAASYLESYDEPQAEEGLAKVARDQGEDPDLLDYCGESLAGIWSRKGVINFALLSQLAPPALAIV